ncbi:DUF305 domain-containing protein [Pseudomonas gingeri NCPPB 3146 = LMG 5327]|uniref:DUF4142 domain-containing protein n=3 Tax=Pseudomonas gingeri TaxID=117681 RepID=A0A7Y8CFG5_9PSED|nr:MULTISPECIES: DUF4142 domain-containing protein [Pseudomonas]NVZ60479.1 DUF4142 domain-containing protein [Pseudomonas gingeri]NVZ74240.1 DUF4142 domain-containing protein [Pseudomonas gingeri]NWA09681.1 DUF4142 domain-containing protein [Pseudomonas gingeri]NWC16227.1 DUF4142 domain-containing protein [Pseudomonas gingeri]NWE48059.1 DUF4142 domain-containing protein [Pseudomonas gingeri]
MSRKAQRLRPMFFSLILGASLTAHAVAGTPAEFIDNASAAGIAEIETSRLAIQKTTATDINSYAVEMIKDHTDANRDLKAIATRHNLPMASDAQIMDQARKLMLQVQEGESFDVAYVANQIKSHEQVIKLFEDEARDSQSPELKAFAQQTLPKLEMHLDMARKLEMTHHKGD